METNEEFELEIKLELELTPLSDVYFPTRSTVF